jgi:hypothetical protein
MFLAFTVLTVFIGAVFLFLRMIEQTVMDAYRVWGTGDMLVEYMEANDGQWPQNWDDIRQFMADHPRRYAGVAGFEDVHGHMDIDFTFDPWSVETSSEFEESKPAFRATWLRNGKTTRYEGTGPNEIIFRYLKSRASTGTLPSRDGSEQNDARERPSSSVMNGESITAAP